MNERQVTKEIDILFLLKKLWQKKVIITLSAVVTAIVTLLVSVFLITPMYTATTSFYVGTTKAAGANITAQDLVAGDYLTKDYKELILSNDVSNTVISRLNLNMTPAALQNRISVSIPSDTRIISIAVETRDAKRSADIANAVREAASEKIKTVTKIDNVSPVDEATVPENPSSPDIKRNVVLGGLVAVLISSFVIIVIELVDNRIKRSEDIEDILRMPLLGVVPNMEKIK